MSIQILDPRTCSSWDEMILRTPGGSLFHSSAWAHVLSESYGYTPLYFAFPENDRFKVLIPMMEVDSLLTGRRGVSLPFTDYCDPLLDGALSFQELFSQMVEYGKKRKWKYIELRGGSDLVPRFLTGTEKRAASNDSFSPQTSILAPGSDGPQSSILVPGSSSFSPQPPEAPGLLLEPRTSNLEPVPRVPRSSYPVPIFITYLGHTLDLTKGEKKIFSGFRDSTRRNVKKAIAQGVEVKMSNEPEAIREFYRLNCVTRREHGLPPQPYHFFQKVYDHIISRRLGFVALASHHGRNIAGTIFFNFGDKAIFKYGASDIKFQDLRATNVVMWEGIRWFCSNGYRSFCFGRTQLGNGGLKQFKSGWSPVEHQIRYFRYNLAEEAFVPCKTKGAPIYTGLFRQLPNPMLKGIGSLFYRHMG